MINEEKDDKNTEINKIPQQLEVNDYPNVLFYSDSQCVFCGKKENLIITHKDRKICKDCVKIILDEKK